MKKNNTVKQPVYCANCGEFGHVYRVCTAPISSFGIICVRKGGNGLEYLMVQRNDSLSYVEFIRGKYNVQNRAYIKNLLANMTIDERNRLTKHDFEQLWMMFWQPDRTKSVSSTMRMNSKEYNQSKNRFELLSKGYKFRGKGDAVDTLFSLEVALNETNSDFEETEFGFPKGRRNINETEIHCSFREFQEETSIPSSDLTIITDVKGVPTKFQETFMGTNGIWYKHVYYIATLRSTSPSNNNATGTLIPSKTPIQMKEIRASVWHTYDGVIKSIRNTHLQRLVMFQEVHGYLNSHMLT